MSAPISGRLTKFTFNSVEYDTRDLSIEITGETIDTSSSSTADNWKTFLPSGWSSWTATVNGLQLTGVADPALQTVYTAIFAIDGSRNYTGSAILTGISLSSSVTSTDPVTKSYTLQGTAAVTLTNGA
jgi:hypothetical protein